MGRWNSDLDYPASSGCFFDHASTMTVFGAAHNPSKCTKSQGGRMAAHYWRVVAWKVMCSGSDADMRLWPMRKNSPTCPLRSQGVEVKTPAFYFLDRRSNL
jgi:hypothetical protein